MGMAEVGMQCVECGSNIIEAEGFCARSGFFYCLKCCKEGKAGSGWRKLIATSRPTRPHVVDTHRDTPAKHDANKPRYDLIPPEGIEAIARVLTYGAGKYGDRNWEGGLAWGRVFAACMRHLWAWWRGEGVDEESGLSHLAHAACCLVFLIAYEARGVGEDDRKRRAE